MLLRMEMSTLQYVYLHNYPDVGLLQQNPHCCVRLDKKGEFSK